MNIRLLKFYSLIRGLVPVYPIYLLMFESKGLSLGEISLLLAIWAAPVVLLELPTGILSDHWARKNMLVIGGLLQGVCYILWFFSESFLLLLLALYYGASAKPLIQARWRLFFLTASKRTEMRMNLTKSMEVWIFIPLRARLYPCSWAAPWPCFWD